MELTPYQIDVISAKICPYCKSSTEVVTETDIYGREYKGRSMIRCGNYLNCNSYVGTHKDGEPLGRLANKQLREAKSKAHKYFDKLWNEDYIERSEAYEMLADHLGIPNKYCHIGMFRKETCDKVVEWSINKYDELK